MKKFGFTLAEILVSVTIIGVMAALTLPTLRTNTVNAQIGPKLAKAVSTFEQANESLLTSLSSDTLTDAGVVTNAATYINNLSRFLKGSNVGGNFLSKDNIQYRFNIEDAPANIAAPAYQQRIGNITININGASRPNSNASGTDIFMFAWYNDGSLRPWGGTNWNENANSQPGEASHWDNDAGCQIDEIPANPDFCAGHIFENNLRVLYN